MNPAILNRKGARKVDQVPSDVLQLLNTGEIESVNLTEWLAIDHALLLESVLPKFGIPQTVIAQITQAIRAQKKPTAMNSTKLVGKALYEWGLQTNQLPVLFSQLSDHTADAVRCYAAYLVGLDSQLTLAERLAKAQPLAADQHFGVREVIWMAIRPVIALNLKEAIKILATWTNHQDENVRRFAVESTRPRGVWCKHIDQLKEQPELALPILDPLQSDPAKYVQDSVGNWLNDASKSRPDFVVTLCDRWKKESPTKATEKIIKKARRTIDKLTP